MLALCKRGKAKREQTPDDQEDATRGRTSGLRIGNDPFIKPVCSLKHLRRDTALEKEHNKRSSICQEASLLFSAAF